jgi:hypothetical protein
MSEEPKSFTVKDRRHFTPDGRTREDAAPGDTAPEPAVEGPPIGTGSPAPPSDGSEPPARSAFPGSDQAPRGPGDFAQFLVSLGAQAGLLLTGQIESENGREALHEARSLISILEMLQDKTEGRRTPDEDRVLDDLLYDLRMAYVARAREAGE